MCEPLGVTAVPSTETVIRYCGVGQQEPRKVVFSSACLTAVSRLSTLGLRLAAFMPGVNIIEIEDKTHTQKKKKRS